MLKAGIGAASSAYNALNVQDRGQTDRAACLWRDIFGDAFSAPDCGCPVPEEESTSGGSGLTITGIGGISTPARPVKDNPQG